MLTQHAAAQDSDREDSDFDEIVVTGSARGVSQFESSIAVTTFDEEDIRAEAPLTITDLYASSPGIWAETSGGEAAANVFVRGIPAPGQYRFTKLQIDGMPSFEESGLPFTPPESFIKLDEMISRAEVIRGGTATIFASNAAGGIVNNITKKGSDVPEGFLGYEWGNFGHHRVDGYYAGPITDDWSFAAGGFYRISDGVRDPGFTGNEGGQFRINLTRRGVDSELNIYAHAVNDRTIFYLPIPLGLDSDGDLTSIPGFDANFDTLTSNDVARAGIVVPGGINNPDLTDGIHTEAFSFGGNYEREIGAWTLRNNARYVDGDVVFNAIFSLSSPESAADFLDGALESAQEAFEGTDRLALRFLGDGAGTESTFNLAGNNGNGLVIQSGWWNQETSVQNFMNDLRLSRGFEAAGDHTVSFGAYGSFASYASFWNFNDILQEVAGSPRGLEVFAVDDDGEEGAEVVGAVTQNSFIQYGDFYRNYEADVRVLAIYGTDEWQVTPALRLDAGFRFEQLRIDGNAERLASFDLSDENPFVATTGIETLADDNVTFGSGIFDPFEETYEEFAWSVGFNYTLTDEIAFYGRANDAFRTPDPNDLAANPAASGALPVNDIFQAEGGVKIDTPWVRAFATVFYSDFTDQIFSDPVLDETGSAVEAQVLLASETIGLEAELDIGPFAGFGGTIRATIQDPEIESFEVVGGGFGVVGEDFVGNDIQRIADRIFIFRPTYEFDMPEFNGSIYTEITRIGDRFSNNTNTVLLPAYTTLGAGMLLNFGDGLELTVAADNLTNTIGVQEGNPRTDAFLQTGDVSVATFARPILGRNVRVKLGYRF
ncbi:TonB-dependent receptor [Parvularcula maris]|uniref:TonB-dependent receptor n=1 Tax=Parvularcula maris TaxID=2965077 RepID=A0A9X2LB32_9PROT|nr:TonB-dependent receptor [Parvularcula maris]